MKIRPLASASQSTKTNYEIPGFHNRIQHTNMQKPVTGRLFLTGNSLDVVLVIVKYDPLSEENLIVGTNKTDTHSLKSSVE
jgi:hypothetical protein